MLQDTPVCVHTRSKLGGAAWLRLPVHPQVDLATGAGLDACLSDLTVGGRQLVAIINCAAVSQPAVCEQDPAAAEAVNVPATLLDALDRWWQRRKDEQATAAAKGTAEVAQQAQQDAQEKACEAQQEERDRTGILRLLSRISGGGRGLARVSGSGGGGLAGGSDGGSASSGHAGVGADAEDAPPLFVQLSTDQVGACCWAWRGCTSERRLLAGPAVGPHAAAAAAAGQCTAQASAGGGQGPALGPCPLQTLTAAVVLTHASPGPPGVRRQQAAVVRGGRAPPRQRLRPQQAGGGARGGGALAKPRHPEEQPDLRAGAAAGPRGPPPLPAVCCPAAGRRGESPHGPPPDDHPLVYSPVSSMARRSWSLSAYFWGSVVRGCLAGRGGGCQPPGVSPPAVPSLLPLARAEPRQA